MGSTLWRPQDSKMFIPMEHGESPRNPWNPATYTDTFPLFSTQSPGLEQKQGYGHTHHPHKKNSTTPSMLHLRNIVKGDVAAPRTVLLLRGCIKVEVENEQRDASAKTGELSCKIMKDDSGGMDINTSWRCSVYSYQGLEYHVPLLQHHQEEVMIFFLQENDLGFTGIPVNPWPRPRGLGFGMPKTRCLTSLPNTWRTGPWQRHGCWGPRPWRYA